MEERSDLSQSRAFAVVDALLGAPDRPESSAGAATVWVAESLAEDPRRWQVPHALAIAEAKLPQLLRARRKPPLVLALAELSPTVLRALRDHPPALLVLGVEAVDAALFEDLESLCASAGTWLLGPGALLRIGPGHLLVTAGSGADIELLLSAGLTPALAVAPATSWLSQMRGHPRFRAALGFLPRAALDLAWLAGHAYPPETDVLVPIGAPEPELDRPRHPDLESAVTAHGLELRTGPVYPDPRIVAWIWRANHGEAPALQAATSSTVDTSGAVDDLRWAQARRALPQSGRQPGMEAVLSELRAAPCEVAFLAQKSVLRGRATAELAEGLSDDGSEITLDPRSDHDDVGDTSARERALAVLHEAGEILSDHESKVVLKGFGFEITRQAVANSASRAVEYAQRLGYPVALKVLSPDLRRKSEIGAIALDVGNAAAVRRAYADLLQNVEIAAPGAYVDGVVVAEMVAPGLDIHCGGLRMRNHQVALFARPLGVGVPVDASWCLATRDPMAARLHAHAILSSLPVPELRRASDPQAGVLVEILLRLWEVFAATGNRLLRVDLNPIRLTSDARRHVVLDATIEQRPHVEGT